MAKQKFTIEHPLSANSESIIWELVSTAEGLSKWMADEVTQEGDSFLFSWGKPWEHHESRMAVITLKKKNKTIRFKWRDDEDIEDYWEFTIEHYDLTEDYTLLITDFAEKNEMDDQKELWMNSLNQLHRTTGL